MHLPPDKKVVCLTGTVWTGARSAPRRILVREGFVRPVWFTTGRAVHDAQYRLVSESAFRAARAQSQILAHAEHGGDHVGIFERDFEDAATASRAGVLVVAFPEIAAQIAEAIPQTYVFSFKDKEMDLCGELDAVASRGQLHRLDIDVLAPAAWTDVNTRILETVGLARGDARY